MIKFLKQLFSMNLAVIEHPIFGELALRKGKEGFYWTNDTNTSDVLAISIDTTDNLPPSDKQAAFYQNIISDQDAAFSKVSGLVIKEYEEVMGCPFPTKWQSALKLCGLNVPLEGNPVNPWDISFECLTDDVGYIFTCYLVNGIPNDISVDT